MQLGLMHGKSQALFHALLMAIHMSWFWASIKNVLYTTARRPILRKHLQIGKTDENGVDEYVALNY